MPGADDPSEHKRELRGRLRERRRRLGASEVASARESAERHAPIAGLRTVAGYLATEGEIPVDGILLRALRDGASVLLPRMRADGGIDFVALDGKSAATVLASVADGVTPPGFSLGRGGILEPSGPAVDPSRVALPAAVLLPAVALDRAGRRLGRGGGAYDRVLGGLRDLGWRAIGVCHSAHLLERVPSEPHDAPVDALLTDLGLFEVARPAPRQGDLD